MNAQETLDRIAALVATHERGAAALGVDAGSLAASIRTVLDARAFAVEAKADSRAEWATEVRAAASVARERIGGDLGQRLELILNTGASFVEHGSDLGGGIMAYRFKVLAQATVVHAHTDAARVRAALDAADALRAAGELLFTTGGAPLARPAWKAEEALRAAFGFADPDAATATPDPEKRK